ncbi:hypothetical protein D3C78_1828550 [compost metagenome]
MVYWRWFFWVSRSWSSNCQNSRASSNNTSVAKVPFKVPRRGEPGAVAGALEVRGGGTMDKL